MLKTSLHCARIAPSLAFSAALNPKWKMVKGIADVDYEMRHERIWQRGMVFYSDWPRCGLKSARQLERQLTELKKRINFKNSIKE